MRYLAATILPAISRFIPGPVKTLAKRLGLSKAWGALLDKHTAELTFQTRWAKAYKDNSAALERDLEQFWSKYRCLDKIKELCEIGEESTVLDVGCGIATVLHILRGNRFGIDPLAEEYRKMYNYPCGISVMKGEGENIPFDDGFFDFVFCSNVLDHVTDPAATLEEVRRVLKPGGFFILIVEIFSGQIKRNSAHPHSLGLNDLNELVNSGFENLHGEKVPWHSDDPDAAGFVGIFRKTAGKTC